MADKSQETQRMFEMSEDEYREVSEDNGGYCLACGEHAYGVEPDASNYECEACGAKEVFGAEQLLIMGRIQFTEE